ncbi:MAG TPA: hypothetical protein VHL57_07525 [Flavobacteriales bacterium]|jgi:hypothetical protein|nr:hypothetical protein [Flavobacteriales bacterium]
MLTRPTLLAIVGVSHLLVGVLFLLFTANATDLLVVDPPPRAVLLVRGLGGILIAFGLINLLARKSTDVVALRAIITGMLAYLVITVAFDLRWMMAGLLCPLAWATMVIRALFAVAYARALWQLRH